jgi:hypothetical protein
MHKHIQHTHTCTHTPQLECTTLALTWRVAWYDRTLPQIRCPMCAALEHLTRTELLHPQDGRRKELGESMLQVAHTTGQVSQPWCTTTQFQSMLRMLDHKLARKYLTNRRQLKHSKSTSDVFPVYVCDPHTAADPYSAWCSPFHAELG